MSVGDVFGCWAWVRTGARPFQYTGLGEEAPDPAVFPGRGLAGLDEDSESE